MNATELQEVVDEFFLVEKDWNEEDHPRDEIGRFAWAGGGGVAGKLANLIRVAGGFTYQPVTDSQPKTGKMVGKPGHEKTFKGIPTVAQIRGYLVENATEFKDPAAYCGGWHNPEDDTTYLDVSERYETDEEAAAASIAAHQEAYYDLATGETTYVRAREAGRLEAEARAVQAGNERRRDPADHRRDLGETLRAILLKEFDPDQPRDERGQWTDEGGGVATAEPKSQDERIAGLSVFQRNVIEVGHDLPWQRAAFVAEDGRIVSYKGFYGLHNELAAELGYSSVNDAIRDGMTRIFLSDHTWADTEKRFIISIQGKDRDHVRSVAHVIDGQMTETQRESARYVWDISTAQRMISGEGTYHDLMRSPMTKARRWWQRLKAILTGEKRSQDQLARDRLALNRLGAERLARLAEDAINDYVPELSRGISETTYDAIKGAVVMARSEGSGSIEVQRAIDHLFSPERAQRVAITETTRLFGKGSQAVYREQGVTGWQWSTCNDPWVCPICEALEDEVFEADDEFEPAHVNCRCFPRPYMIETSD